MANADLATIERPVDDSPKRRLVVKAAYDLFLAHGYGAVSMDAIARSAGVSKATLYAYFASKDELFANIVNERRIAKGLDDLMVPERVPDLRAALKQIGAHILNFMLREETLAIYRIAIAESGRFPELGRAFFANGPQRSCDTAQAWLATQQAAGLVRPADLVMATQQFMSLLRAGVFMRASLALPPPPTGEEIDATVDAAVDTWLRAFATELGNPSAAN